VVATIQDIAEEMARWLRTRSGASEVRVAFEPRKRSKLPLPVPRALRPPQPSFELHFMFKGRPRVFRYFIEQQDDAQMILSTLKVHTNGELMVTVPNGFGQPQPNDIYYSNRSTTAPGLGEPSPNFRTRQ
jgi:hypothetical protein